MLPEFSRSVESSDNLWMIVIGWKDLFNSGDEDGGRCFVIDLLLDEREHAVSIFLYLDYLDSRLFLLNFPYQVFSQGGAVADCDAQRKRPFGYAEHPEQGRKLRLLEGRLILRVREGLVRFHWLGVAFRQQWIQAVPLVFIEVVEDRPVSEQLHT